MDRTLPLALTRLTGAAALAALLLYGGAALERQALAPAAAGALVAVTALGAAAAVWGLASLHENPLAAWLVLALLGAAPVAAFLGWWTSGFPAGLVGALLWLNLLAGLAVAAGAAWVALARPAADGERRVPRVG